MHNYSLRQIRQKITDKFRGHFDRPVAEADYLICEVLKVERSHIYRKLEDIIDREAISRLDVMSDKRLAGYPFAYLSGTKEFYGLPFYVNESVLIPRPETELLVELAVDLLSNRNDVEVLDIGTGSGCVAIAIGKQLVSSNVVGWELEPQALCVAKKNAELLEAANVRFVEADVMAKESWKGEFDLIVSNPPYIEVGDPELELGVMSFEPKKALYADNKGLLFYETFAKRAQSVLKSEGHIAVEVGKRQKEAVVQLFSDQGWALVLEKNDLQGIPRALVFKC